MKKALGILSLSVLLFSTFAPSFTYATGEVGIQAQEILSDTLIDSMYMFENSRGVTSLQQSQEAVNLFGDQEEDQINTNEEADPKIEYDNENKLITITSEKYNHSITLKDKNVGAENVGDYGDYLSFSTTICPTGFHTPSKIEWENLILLYSLIKNNESDFATDFKLPYAGVKQNGNFLGSTVSNLGYYWSSTDWTGGDNNGFYTLIKKEDGTIKTDKYYPKGMFSLTIRCFKNNNEKIKLVKFNPNGGAFSGMRENKTKIIKYTYNGDEIIPINNIQIPDRISNDMSQQSGWMFDGWYTKDGTNNDWGEEFDISNPNSTTAYAKWLPFNDLAVTLGDTTFIIIDRNLGAEGIASGTYYGYNVGHEDYNKFGSYYQWGNNHGFKNNQIINTGTELIENPNHIEFPRGPNNYYYNNKYIKRLGPPYRWNNEINQNLWGGEYYINSDNDKQGPCPKGYHIPDALEWNAVYIAFKNEQSTECTGDTTKIGECFAKKLKLPFAGNLKTNNEYQYQGYNGNYWASSNYPDYNSAYYLHFNSLNILPLHSTNRAANSSVRCFKNTYNTLTFKVNGNIIKENNVRWREPVLSYMKPVDPEKENSIFKGWYINGGDEKFEFSKSTYISGDVVLSPRFECKAGYKETDDGSGCERVRVDFDANSGVFFDGSKKLSVDISTIGVSQEITKTSHTPNFTDEGNFVTEYDTSVIFNESFGGKNMLFYEPAYIDTIGIEGAEKLDITIRYGGTVCGRNKTSEKYVRTGEHLEYSPLNGNVAFLSIKTGPSIEGETEEINRVLSGNAITIYKGQGCPDYGRYVIMTGFVKGEEGVYSEDAFDNIPSPILTGFNFKGWYNDQGDIFDSGNVSTTEITKVYAKWNPHHYKIKFNINGGTGDVENKNATYGEEINLPNVTREGYTFRGWQSEDGVLYNKIIPEGTGVTTEDGVTVTLTAQWDIIPPSAGGGSTINPTKQKNKATEQEHNSADTEDQKVINTQTNTPTINTVATEEIKQQVNKVQERSLTRGEVAIMTNILLEVYPQLVEGKQELDDVTNACSNYADEQNFTKDEKKAITRLCKLSIMGIHNDTNEPLEEFLVNNKSTNDEFSKVINRSIETYNEKDLTTIKDALKKLEGDEENVVFGTIYDVFMNIKNIFN